MPIEFDPEWEYYVGDSEVEELLRERRGEVTIDNLLDIAIQRNGQVSGIRMGKGNPDSLKLHMGPERQSRAYEDTWGTCPKCKQCFKQTKYKATYCSLRCARTLDRPQEVLDKFRTMYNDGKTVRVIAKELQIGRDTIVKWVGQFGLGKRKPGAPRKNLDKTCRCGIIFKPRHKTSKYCSYKCKNQAQLRPQGNVII